ncbi:MAG: DNA mismatch repair endonuclease MutL [Eubacterium sp.]|nr:DNA mismatch repair endonuclease MutL [Eubacterium sp.]
MIKVLEKQVADKIAAGEVIERPASIIKELVENSIDAGAKSVTVEIKNGGKSYIRVTDDGCGISHDELRTAFLRHATSKISEASDLDSITSLGFRGEALASIAAVTRTSMVTKRHEDQTGSRIVIEGGEVLSVESVGCPDGTTVVSTDLFYNTPARREFLKNDAHETAAVTELVSEMALAFSGIRIQLISNGNVIFTTTGDGNIKNTVVSVYKKREYRDLFTIEGEYGGYRIKGCISRPSLSRSTRKDQVFCVNGRVVESKVIEKGIRNGYRERLFEGRYPVVFLLIDTDPSSIDVNIHPNKKEIRFHDEESVIRAVSQAIIQGLQSDEAVIKVGDYFHDKDVEKPLKNEQVDIKNVLSNMRKNAESTNTRQIIEETHADTKERLYGDDDRDDRSVVNDNVSTYEKGSDDVENSNAYDEKNVPDPGYFPHASIADFDMEPGHQLFDFDDLKLTGCIFDTYLTCEDSNAFYLIDQHAAHERVNYEKFVGNYLSDDKPSQPLLTPVTFDVDPSTYELQDEWIPELEKMGFAVEPFGPGTFIIKEIPVFMELSEAEAFAADYAESLGDEMKHSNKVVIDKLITRSCKASVKAHDHLSMEEAEELLAQLRLCRNPFSCPHGRPTFIRFTQYQIEKFFKRIQ